jgi:diacylglycerol O-acyltransferase
VLTTLEERLHLFPPFRKKLAPVPLQLHHPVWVDDDAFDLEYHVRRACVPTPGGQAELAAFAADVMSRPLDRSRPLWEIWMVEGLEDGNVALVAKAHHSIIDGVGGTDLMVALLDLEQSPDPVPPPTQPFTPEPRPSDAALVAGAVRDLARQPVRAAKAARRLGGEVVNLVRGVRQSDDSVELPVGSPRTVLNTTIGPRRQMAFAKFSLDDAKRVRKEYDCTVNDVILAVCGGALRNWLERQGEELDSSLVATMLVSLRTEEHAGQAGNQLGGVLVPLATDVDDPAERLRKVNKATTQAKEIQAGVTGLLMTDWAEFATPMIANRAFRLVARTRLLERVPPLWNVSISNIPGPDFPLYINGARLVSMYPVGPVMDGNALNITVVSYMGTVWVGLIACRDNVPDIAGLAASIPESMRRLLRSVEAA